MAGTVRNTRGAIGYVENAYAITNRLVTTQIRNKAGHFVKPNHESFLAAASNANWGNNATDPTAIFDVSRAETQIRPQWDHEGPVPVARLGFQPNEGAK